MSTRSLPPSRMAKVIRGIAGGFAGRIVTLIAPFLVMPALLADFGERGFGIWATAVSLTTMAAFLDFGMGNAVLTRLSKALANDALWEARVVIVTGYLVLSAIAAILIGLVLLGSTHFAHLIVPSFDEQDLAILRAIMLAFALSLPISLIQRLLYAQQKVAQANAWLIAGSALSISLCLLAIAADLTPSWVAFLYAIGTPLALLFATFLFFLNNSALRPSIRDYDPMIAKGTFGSGFAYFVLSILTSIGLNIDQVLISAMFGPDQVVNYTVPARLASVLMLTVSILYMPLWPANAEAIARNDWVWVRRNNLRMSLFGSAIVAASGLCLYLLSDTIIMLWMGREFPGQSEIVAAAAILAIAMSFTSPFNMILNAAHIVFSQILIWMIFISISVSFKVYCAGEDKFWLLPLISSLSYIFLITIPVLFLTRKAVKEREMCA